MASSSGRKGKERSWQHKKMKKKKRHYHGNSKSQSIIKYMDYDENRRSEEERIKICDDSSSTRRSVLEIIMPSSSPARSGSYNIKCDDEDKDEEMIKCCSTPKGERYEIPKSSKSGPPPPPKKPKPKSIISNHHNSSSLYPITITHDHLHFFFFL